MSILTIKFFVVVRPLGSGIYAMTLTKNIPVMKMIPCRDCGNAISKKAAKCPQCGAPQKRKRGCFKLLIIGFIGFIVLGVLYSLLDSDSAGSAEDHSSPNQTSTPSEAEEPNEVIEPATPRIEYEIVKSWNIPNGGQGKVITITKDHANLGDMKILASTIKTDVAEDRNAFLFVFTTKKAAMMRDRLDSLTSEERTYYRKNYVGTYRKNSNSNLEEIDIHPKGMTGPSKNIKL